jgi:hypothetical protein
MRRVLFRQAELTTFRINFHNGTSGSRTPLALDSAYVHLTSGDAIAARYRAPVAGDPINEFYAFVDLTTGTRASISLRCRIYGVDGTGARPDSTLLATASSFTYPAADDRWCRFVFDTPYTPAAGEWVMIVVDNNSASPTVNFPSFLNQTAADSVVDGSAVLRILGYETTAGFSANGTARLEACHVLVTANGNKVYGNPFCSHTALTAFTGRRGILVDDKCRGLYLGDLRVVSGSTGYQSVQIFEFSKPPTSSPFFSRDISGSLDKIAGYASLNLETDTFPGSGPWVICINSTSSVGGNGYMLIEDYSSYSSVFDKFYDNFKYCPTVTESAGNWVVDRSRCGGIAVDVDGFVQFPAGRIISGGV